jgi:hypothetical protein
MDTVQIIVQEQHRENVQIIVQEVAGPAGLDNYKIAVVNGYVGTIAEYLASMRGPAFTHADFTTEQLLALKGDAFTYADFTPEQLEALKIFVEPVVIAQALIYAEPIAVDFADSANATVTLTGDAAVELANVPDGAKGAIYVTQDEVGARLLTGITHEGLTVKVKGGALTLSSAPGAIDKLEFERVGTILLVSVVTGF